MSNRDRFVSDAVRGGYSPAEAMDEYDERFDLEEPFEDEDFGDGSITKEEIQSIFNHPGLLEEPVELWICYSGRSLRIDHGVFTTEEGAEKWAASADKWRGRMHPLFPHKVEKIRVNPPLWPDFGADED